jgi:hypothetical protein
MIFAIALLILAATYLWYQRRVRLAQSVVDTKSSSNASTTDDILILYGNFEISLVHR